MHNLQRYLAKQAYGVAQPGLSDQFLIAWPAIQNFVTFQGDSRVIAQGISSMLGAWYDSTKPHKA